MKEFNIEIRLKFIENIDFETIHKEYIYHKEDKSNKDYKDSITISRDKITISVKRTSTQDIEKYLFTRKSRGYRECVSSLLFLYYKFGSFKIEGIKICTHEIFEYNQKFEKKLDFKLNDDVLDCLFNYRDDSVYIPLMHIVEGINNPEYKLEHSWKAFNKIYNTVCENNQDTDCYTKIFEYMKNDTNNVFETIFLDAKNLLVGNGGIDTGKAISFMCKNEHKKYLEIQCFENIFKINGISDKELLKKLKDIFSQIYLKNKKDYDSNKNTGQYEHKNTKIYGEQIKKFDKKINMNKEEKTDYLQFLLHYMFYLRNKSMHGVFQSPSFLFDNEHTNELVRYGDLLMHICLFLLKNGIIQQ